MVDDSNDRHQRQLPRLYAADRRQQPLNEVKQHPVSNMGTAATSSRNHSLEGRRPLGQNYANNTSPSPVHREQYYSTMNRSTDRNMTESKGRPGHQTQSSRPLPGPGTYSPEHSGPAARKTIQTYSFGSRPRQRSWDNDVPGPGSYSPEKSIDVPRSNRFAAGPTFGSRHRTSVDNLPGPGSYNVNPHVTRSGKSGGPRYSIGGRLQTDVPKDRSPVNRLPGFKDSQRQKRATHGTKSYAVERRYKDENDYIPRSGYYDQYNNYYYSDFEPTETVHGTARGTSFHRKQQPSGSHRHLNQVHGPTSDYHHVVQTYRNDLKARRLNNDVAFGHTRTHQTLPRNYSRDHSPTDDRYPNHTDYYRPVGHSYRDDGPRTTRQYDVYEQP
jgi:hypothetical protein